VTFVGRFTAVDDVVVFSAAGNCSGACAFACAGALVLVSRQPVAEPGFASA